jgi:uncharacterized protein (DUF302 family)
VEKCEPSPLFVQASRFRFDETVERLADAIEKAGMSVFSRIDHCAAAKAVGLHIPPTMVLLYGNPAKGTLVMMASSAAALDLPLRLLVRENDRGAVTLSFHPVVDMLLRLGVPLEVAARMEPAQTVLLGAIA